MTSKTKSLLLIFLAVIFCSGLQAQDNMINQLDLSKDITTWYDDLLGIENTLLMEGALANYERKASRTHPYLNDYIWQLGNIVYRSQEFKSVPLLYNLEQDALFILRKGGNSYENFVELNKALVSGFTVGNSRYVKLDSMAPNNAPGFYELLYEGNQASFYARRVKKQDLNGDEDYQYKQLDDYYVLFEGQYYAVRNVGAVTRIFKENRKQIRSFANTQRMRQLEKESELQFIALIAFCNTLAL
jgi:hypothetical protein